MTTERFYTVPWVDWLPEDMEIPGDLLRLMDEVIDCIAEQGQPSTLEIAQRLRRHYLAVCGALKLAQTLDLIEPADQPGDWCNPTVEA